MTYEQSRFRARKRRFFANFINRDFQRVVNAGCIIGDDGNFLQQLKELCPLSYDLKQAGVERLQFIFSAAGLVKNKCDIFTIRFASLDQSSG